MGLEKPESQDNKPEDPSRRSFLGRAAALGAAGLAGAAIVHSQNKAGRRAEEAQRQESLNVGFLAAGAIQRTLSNGGSVKMELKRDPETKRIQGMAELFDERGRQIPGGFVKLGE